MNLIHSICKHKAFLFSINNALHKNKMNSNVSKFTNYNQDFSFYYNRLKKKIINDD